MSIAASIFAADFANLSQEIAKVEDRIQRIHFDVMDGHFVRNFALSPCILKAVKKITNLPVDVHLMITNPITHIESFVNAGAQLIYIHVECEDVIQTLEKIKSYGIQTGVALNPETTLESLNNQILKLIDSILVMTVHPGFSGQVALKEALIKADLAKKRFFNKKIAVDGGINWDIMTSVKADVYVMGSALFRG